MSVLSAQAREVTEALRARLSGKPVDWGIVCGSGVGHGLIDGGTLGLQVELRVELRDLGLPVPGVEGHGQAVVWGTVGEQHVVVQTGRLHPYEGHGADLCTAALAGMIESGASRIALTCAVGSLRDRLGPGDLCVLSDQINLLGPTPLRGPRFVDCGQLYSPVLRERLRTLDETLEEAVYIHCRGPQYETPAEVEALRSLGGDVVGMSTTYEAILAASLGASTCGVAIVTNSAGRSGTSHEEVKQRSAAAVERLGALLARLIGSDG